MIFAALLFLVCILFLFSGGLTLVYKLSKGWRYRATVQTWVVAFVLEILLLVCVDEHYVLLLKLTIHNGLYYILALTLDIRKVLPGLFRGQDPDIVLVLLLPVLPVLLGFWYDRRRVSRPF